MSMTFSGSFGRLGIHRLYVGLLRWLLNRIKGHTLGSEGRENQHATHFPTEHKKQKQNETGEAGVAERQIYAVLGLIQISEFRQISCLVLRELKAASRGSSTLLWSYTNWLIQFVFRQKHRPLTVYVQGQSETIFEPPGWVVTRKQKHQPFICTGSCAATVCTHSVHAAVPPPARI